MIYGKFQVGANVTLNRDELLDDAYNDKDKTVVKAGTLMQIVAITPKVCMIKGDGNDSKPYFLNLVIANSNSRNRVRTNFCNVTRV